MQMTKDPLVAIQEWYSSKCNDEWEHCHGITIRNIDNPGWAVSISGEQNRQVTTLKIDRSELDWIRIDASSEVFSGYCGAGNLRELLLRATDWLDSTNNSPSE